jgi:uncharacterized protein (TIGR02996 family)
MGGEGAFLAAIRANFSDDTTRLVYADWLDENGRVGGKFLRVECEMAGVGLAANPWGDVFNRLREASRGLDQRWVAAVSRVPVDQLRSRVPGLVFAAARRHVAALPPVKGFVWQLSEGRRVSAGWYFDYSAKRLWPRRGPGTGFGFAPGYLVADDGSVRSVGWGELRQVHGLPPAYR